MAFEASLVVITFLYTRHCFTEGYYSHHKDFLLPVLVGTLSTVCINFPDIGFESKLVPELFLVNSISLLAPLSQNEPTDSFSKYQPALKWYMKPFLDTCVKPPVNINVNVSHSSVGLCTTLPITADSVCHTAKMVVELFNSYT